MAAKSSPGPYDPCDLEAPTTILHLYYTTMSFGPTTPTTDNTGLRTVSNGPECNTLKMNTFVGVVGVFPKAGVVGVYYKLG